MSTIFLLSCTLKRESSQSKPSRREKEDKTRRDFELTSSLSPFSFSRRIQGLDAGESKAILEYLYGICELKLRERTKRSLRRNRLLSSSFHPQTKPPSTSKSVSNGLKTPLLYGITVYLSTTQFSMSVYLSLLYLPLHLFVSTRRVVLTSLSSHSLFVSNSTKANTPDMELTSLRSLRCRSMIPRLLRDERRWDLTGRRISSRLEREVTRRNCLRFQFSD